MAVGTEDGLARKENNEGTIYKSQLLSSVGKEEFMIIECQLHVGPCAGEIKLSLEEEPDL